MQIMQNGNLLSKTQNKIVTPIFILVCALILALTGSMLIMPKANAIVGGAEADNTYSWSAAMTKTNSGAYAGLSIEKRTYCTGVLITPRWVLSAAHCRVVVGDQAVIGRRKLASVSGDVRKVTAVVDMRANSTYCNVTDKNDLCDLALIKLDQNSSQQDADLADSSVLSEWGPNSSARMYGYGATVYGGGISPALRRATTKIVDLRDNHFTLFAQMTGVSFCHGDSGGPLIVSTSKGPRVVGIARAFTDHADPSTYCNRGSTNSYTKVGHRGSSTNSRPFNWIQSVVN